MIPANRATTAAVLTLLLGCGACARPWAYSRSGSPPLDDATPAAAPAEQEPAGQDPAIELTCFRWANGSDLRRLPPCDALGLLDADPLGPAVPCEEFGCGPPCGEPTWRGPLREFGHRVWRDHGNYYRGRTCWAMGYALAGGSVLANTSLDEDFSGWYQRNVRGSETDDLSSFCKTFGEGEIVIPAFAGVAVAAACLPEGPLLSTTGELACRTTRAYLVGAPPMLFMQRTLGASRPGEDPVGSSWKAFDDTNAVSGHAFVGAVPFITAARMAERPTAKTALYACSMLTAWSRIHDDAHFLSQACLGWGMAWLACRAVDETQYRARCWEVVPLATADSSGIGVLLTR